MTFTKQQLQLLERALAVYLIELQIEHENGDKKKRSGEQTNAIFLADKIQDFLEKDKK